MIKLLIKLLIFLGLVIGLTIGSETYLPLNGFLRFIISATAVIIFLQLIKFISKLFTETKPSFQATSDTNKNEIINLEDKGSIKSNEIKIAVNPTTYYITPMPTNISEEILMALDKIRKNPREKINTDELIDAIMDVTDSTVGEIIIMITDLINSGKLARKLLTTGVRTILSVTRKTGKRVFKNLSREQLMIIVNWGESILHVADMDFNDALPIKLDANYMSAMPLSQELGKKAIELLNAAYEDPRQAYYAKAAVDVSMQIVEGVASFYVMKPTELMGVPAFARKLINFAVNISLTVSRPALEKVFESMGKEEVFIAAKAYKVLVRPIEIDICKIKSQDGTIMADFINPSVMAPGHPKDMLKINPMNDAAIGVKADEVLDTIVDIIKVFIDHYLNSGLSMIQVGGFINNMVREAANTAVEIFRRIIKRLLAIREISLDQLMQMLSWSEKVLSPEGTNFVKSLPYTKEEAQQIFDLIYEIKKNPVKGKYTDRIINLAVNLTKISAKYYISDPMNKYKISSLGQGIVNMGISACIHLLKTSGRIIVNNMEKEQLSLAAGRAENFFQPLQPQKLFEDGKP
ncbi:MAG: hypothetical protein HQK76_05020 [Desulfobacterales bacterium]|nr:hypothetical protein [Desulfobacterales bacterium]